jgi:hypothetical protein
MKDEFSIDSLKNQIDSKETAKYFEEVYSSYINGNYRSAVVMLWSVVIYDIINKLQTLKDTYNDPHAINFLNQIAARQKSNSTSSDWELKLIKDVCENTDLIDFIEYKTLEYLQSQRHLSAHPVLKNNASNLYVPNKDITRSLIRGALEIVFIKPPIYTDKILLSLLIDLEDTKSIFTDMAKLQRYVKGKYLDRINAETKTKLFETFWKFVMQKDNPDCNRNRIANLRFLSVLALDNLTEVEKSIIAKQSFYSTIKPNGMFMEPLIVFLARAPSVYPLLDTGLQMLIRNHIESNIELEIAGYFCRDSREEHYDHLETLIMSQTWNEMINDRAWEALQQSSDSKEMESRFTRVLSMYYHQSATFGNANEAYSNISVFIEHFDTEGFEYLLEGGEANNQTYGRGNAQIEYNELKEIITKVNSNFDFTRYPEFNRVVSKRTTTAQ